MSNKKWIHCVGEDGHERHELYFSPFYDEDIVATLWKDCDGDWYYDSELSDVAGCYVLSESIDDIKCEVESDILQQLECQVDYLKTLIDKWNE